MLLSRERVDQVEPLSIALHGITVAPVAEEIRALDLGLLTPFYADDAAFYG